MNCSLTGIPDLDGLGLAPEAAVAQVRNVQTAAKAAV